MNISSRVLSYEDGLIAIRQQIHANPELLFDVHSTASLVEQKLNEYGVDKVITGIGRAGVVGVINGRKGGPVIGLRADMDALPIQETTNLPYSSKKAGLMHACGHDGHTTMLLGAARYLAETRNFSGQVVLIFQPAEEGGGGGKEMVDDGLMERFAIEQVFGLHVYPSPKKGTFAICYGAALAAIDTFSIRVIGRGGHVAKPHTCLDPVIAASDIVTSLQSIVSRSADPMEPFVVSVTTFHAGQTTNIIPAEAILTGSVRTLSEGIRDLAERQIKKIASSVAQAHGCEIEIEHQQLYPVMSNHAEQAKYSADIATELVGADNVNRKHPASMGGEDFAFMLNVRPGAIIFLGQGPGPELHNSGFDFDDSIISLGVSYWVKLVENMVKN
ncbi:M20 aminoacylase family protein [Lentilitoribacter sp. EG35]|uniref:M20 aminoacylase family protein n=1 Tax=Lentilitoribacter sp. EG35 TaxID=3234192 RepID=UPI003460C34F